jgi:hypothetical protein
MDQTVGAAAETWEKSVVVVDFGDFAVFAGRKFELIITLEALVTTTNVAKAGVAGRDLLSRGFTLYVHPCAKWIRTHDPSVQAVEGITLLRPSGYCHRISNI